MIVIYLFWQQINLIKFKEQLNLLENLLGWFLVVFGLVLYVLGRSQRILILDLGAQIPLLLGSIILISGLKGSRVLWFPIFFMIFMLPIPQAFLTMVTMPMKIAVSTVAENFIYHLTHIPVAREGVMLFVGQYRLFVADACAGMHTLISLEALGLLYLNIVKHNSFYRNLILATLIIPISFIANVIRVIILILITYFFGNEVAQSFIHEYAGMVLFIVALSIIFSIDSFIQWGLDRKEKSALQKA
jgi:exosortase B